MSEPQIKVEEHEQIAPLLEHTQPPTLAPPPQPPQQLMQQPLQAPPSSQPLLQSTLTMTPPQILPHTQSQPLLQPLQSSLIMPQVQSQPTTLPATPQLQQQPLITSSPPMKQRLQDLVNEVDPDEQLDEDVEEVLLDIADEFIENVVSSACAIAKHRKSTSLEVDDVKMYLERKYKIWIPGFGESRPIQKRFSSEAHKQRMALINKQGEDGKSQQQSK